MNEEWVDHYVEKILNNEIQFDEVRADLKRKGVDEANIRVIIKSVDTSVQQKLLSGSAGKALNQVILVGIVIAGTGLIITIGSFMGLFAMSGSYLIVVAYGPLLGGIAIILAGLRKTRSGSSRGTSGKKFNVYKARRLRE